MRFRLTRIDELLLPEYAYLSEDDECYFLREYTAGAGYRYGETNSLISNFKKEPRYRGRPEVWRHKVRATDQLAGELAEAIEPFSRLRQALWAPIPPSKLPGHENYDDRLLEILQRLVDRCAIDSYHELLKQKESTRRAHTRTSPRLSPSELRKNYSVEGSIKAEHVVLLDDLVTTGAHFVAARSSIRDNYRVKVSGVFLARTLH